MSSPHDNAFCGHCGERLPRFGAGLGFCSSCAKNYRHVVQNDRPAPEPVLYGQFDEFPKDPLLATILSTIFPGGGQVYNGHLFKALLIFVTSPLVLPYLIGIADAFFSARRHNRNSIKRTTYRTYEAAARPA
ncbi:MAG: hypothetical protein V2A76_18370 [Planctomycetota bacterium]